MLKFFDVLIALALSITVVPTSVLAMEITVVKRTNFTFQADSIGAIDRTKESYSSSPVDPHLENLIKTTIRNTVKLLPTKYLPKRLTVNVESRGVFTAPGKRGEALPLSLVLTTQLPAKDQIRFSNYEIKNDSYSVQTVLAHETGHMLIEWACRKEGVTPPNQTFLSHWSKPIYEGVADYISATVNNTTIIGSSTAWFHRDILQYNSLAAAKNPALSIADVAEQGLTSVGLIPRFGSYRDWIDGVRKILTQLDMKDPYAEGTWLAGQLWKLNDTYGAQTVFNAVLAIAITGEKFDDEQIFLDMVELRLK